jgi:transcriptional regulator with XRE-family HTH domain
VSSILYEFFRILIDMGFRENLKSQLHYSGMLVKELAARSGVKKKTLDSYLSSSAYVPSVETAVRIARVLNVTADYLVTGNEQDKNRLISSLPQDIQEIIYIVEQLSKRDRKVIITLAETLRDRI